MTFLKFVSGTVYIRSGDRDSGSPQFPEFMTSIRLIGMVHVVPRRAELSIAIVRPGQGTFGGEVRPSFKIPKAPAHCFGAFRSHVGIEIHQMMKILRNHKVYDVVLGRSELSLGSYLNRLEAYLHTCLAMAEIYPFKQQLNCLLLEKHVNRL